MAPDAVISTNRVGFHAAWLTAALTLIAFSLAMAAVPNSGAFCPADCAEYPYLDGSVRFPIDFVWMLPAMLVLLSYVVLTICVFHSCRPARSIYGQIALSMGLLSVAILLSDYYIQFFVVPISLANAETDGLALLIQTNPHGVFLALEELGYLLMAVSFLFMAFVIGPDSRVERIVRRVFLIGFGLACLSTAVVFGLYGLGRMDRLEVLLICIGWLVLIVNGVLLSIVFRKRTKSEIRSRG